ncbi:unnamed protein product [Lampetra planeri]
MSAFVFLRVRNSSRERDSDGDAARVHGARASTRTRDERRCRRLLGPPVKRALPWPRRGPQPPRESWSARTLFS